MRTPHVEREEPKGAIKAREKALNASDWGKFVEREHDIKPRTFKFKDSPTVITTDEYRSGWDRIFGGK